MSRRRRILLLALLPTTLGIATLGGFWYASGSADETPASIPVVQGAAPETSGFSAPVENGAVENRTAEDAAEVSVVQPAAVEAETPPTAPADTAPPNDAPVKSEHAEAPGPTLHAQSAAPVTAFDSSASPPIYNSFRIASLAGAGGGSRGSASAGDHVESNDGVNGGPSTPTGGTSEPAGGSDGDEDQSATDDSSGNSSKDDESNQNPRDDGAGPNESLPPLPAPDSEHYPPIFESPPSNEPVLPHVNVPEPASMGLLVLGLLGLTLGRRKRT